MLVLDFFPPRWVSFIFEARACRFTAYPGILGLVDAVIVTSDSVNMISEATITGLPVLIAEWQNETGRIAAFHDAMVAAGHIAPLRDQLPQDGFTPLFEMPGIIKSVLARLNSQSAANRAKGDW